MMYYKNSDGSFSPVAPRINDAAPSNLTTYSGNKVEEIAGLKLDRTGLTISEEIVLYAGHWTNKQNDILFPRDLNNTFVVIPVSFGDWYKYGIKILSEDSPMYISFTCDITPQTDITFKIITAKADTTKDADTRINNINYDVSNHSYYCTETSNIYNDYELVESGIIAVSSDVELTPDEVNTALDVCANDITTHSINEPLIINDEANKIWYIRSYVVYRYTDNPKYQCIKYSTIFGANNGTIIEIENTARRGVYTNINMMRVDPDVPTTFHTNVYSTLSNNEECVYRHYGLIATNDETTANNGLTINTTPVSGVTYIKDNTISSNNLCITFYGWRKSNALGQTWWVRPYVTLSDGNTNTTYYGRMESFTMPSA